METVTNSPADAKPGKTFTCCETPLPWPMRTEDRTCPECGTVWEHDGVDLGAGARIKPQAGAPAVGRPLGPFATSSETLRAMRPGDGSSAGREPWSGLLQEALDEAGVKLGERDMVVLGWLANLDVQTVAVITGWVSRARRAGGASEDSRRLGEIRALLAGFDREHGDRRYALETIERIADGGA